MKFDTLTEEQASVVMQAKKDIEERIGKSTDPVRELVYRDIHHVYVDRVTQATELVDKKNDFEEHLKYAEREETRELFARRIDELDQSIEKVERSLLDVAQAVTEALNADEYDEQVHGRLRQLLLVRIRDIRKKNQSL